MVAWTKDGVLELRLPDFADRIEVPAVLPGEQGHGRPLDGQVLGSEARASETRVPLVAARLMPGWVRRLTERVSLHLEGVLDDFLDVPLALSKEASRFDLDVWQATREVPPGLTISYGELAEEAGHPGAARAAGSSLRRCPIALLIPAHRVIAAGNKPGGWTGRGGLETKLRLLAIEGVVLGLDRTRRSSSG